MARITELHLRNVRCFKGRQSARASRITLLVGVNGSGKSTFLGCYDALAKLANLQTPDGRDLEDENHFDAPPFHMGDYAHLARNSAREFTIGGQFEGHCHTGTSVTYKRGTDDEPLEKELTMALAKPVKRNASFAVSRKSARNAGGGGELWHFQGANFQLDLEHSQVPYRQISTWLSRMARYGFLPFNGHLSEYKKSRHGIGVAESAAFSKFSNFLKELPLPRPRSKSPPFVVRSLAPVPEFQRQNVYDTNPFPKLKKAASNKIRSIGKKTGMWEDIYVADSASSTYEINAKTPDGARNLMDVGHGVYSLLPLALAISEAMQETTFLLQQPESHLHPESQAELASLMAKSGHGFIIETHSEHFTDRFRICLRKGLLKPEDFTIIFFEHAAGATKLHNIYADEIGNIIDPPLPYGDFFMKESGRLLGIG